MIFTILIFSFLAQKPPMKPEQQGNIKHIPGINRPDNQPSKVRRPDNDRGKPVAPIHIGTVRIENYHKKYGVTFPQGHRFAGQFFYRGYDHRHWTNWRWSSRLGCYFYWCPHTLSWFYWCGPDFCYYPVSYRPYGTYTP